MESELITALLKAGASSDNAIVILMAGALYYASRGVARLTALNTSTEILARELHTLNDKVESLSDGLDTANQTLSLMSQRLERTEGDVTSCYALIRTVQAEVHKLDTDIATLRGQSRTRIGD